VVNVVVAVADALNVVVALNVADVDKEEDMEEMEMN
jgi:hypothetical protein